MQYGILDYLLDGEKITIMVTIGTIDEIWIRTVAIVKPHSRIYIEYFLHIIILQPVFFFYDQF